LSKNKYFTYRGHSATKKMKSCSKLPLFESLACLRPFYFNHLHQKKVWFNEKISYIKARTKKMIFFSLRRLKITD